MKRIGDWLEVLGVNTLNQHLTYVTLRGARKRDHPQSFSYHEPWWEAYHVSAEYFARLSLALSQGEQINRVLVLEPTTTAWMYQGDKAKLSEIGDSFFKLLMALEAAQIEYDIGDEDVIARHGSVDGRQLRIGNRTYRQVVLPPLIENLNSQTKAFLDQVGTAVTGTLPERVDGAASNTSAGLARIALPADWMHKVERHREPSSRTTRRRTASRIERTPGDQGILFHHRRQLADGQILFLVNTSIDASVQRGRALQLARRRVLGSLYRRGQTVSLCASSKAASQPGSTCRPPAASCCSCRRNRSKASSRTRPSPRLPPPAR